MTVRIDRWFRAAILTIAALLVTGPALARDIYVSPSGSDTTGKGTIDAPFATLAKMNTILYTGDHVYLRAGVYQGGLRIRQPNVTIEAYQGEHATVTLDTSDAVLDNTIWIFKSGCILRNLEVTGGLYYGVKLETYASNCKLLNLHVHHTGADCIKVVPGCPDVEIGNCEIDHSGLKNTNCQGVDSVNSHRIWMHDNYVHDVQNVGLMAKGGSRDCIFEHNRIERVLIGIQLGQNTDRGSMSYAENPRCFEIIRPICRDNLIIDASGSGISCWAAQGAVIQRNVLWNVTKTIGAGILLQNMMHYPREVPPFATPCEDVTIEGNYIRLRPDSVRFAIYVLQAGLTPGTLHLSQNTYCQEGHDVRFVDTNRLPWYNGTLPGWAARMGETGSMALPQKPAGLSGPPVSPAPAP